MKTEKVVHGNVTYWVEYGPSIISRGGHYVVDAVGKLHIKRDTGELLQGQTESYRAFGATEKQAIEGACIRASKRLERIAEFISGDSPYTSVARGLTSKVMGQEFESP